MIPVARKEKAYLQTCSGIAEGRSYHVNGGDRRGSRPVSLESKEG